MSCQTTCALGYLLLYISVGDESIDGWIMNIAVAGIKPFSGNSSANCERMTLTQRTGSVLDHSLNLTLRVSGCHRPPLTEVLEVLEGKLTRQTELGIEHRCHVAGVKEETIACFPSGVLRIVLKELAKEHIDEICATHSSARVTTLGFLYCCSSQNTNIVRCTI